MSLHTDFFFLEGIPKKSSSAPQVLDNNFAKPANKDIKDVPNKDTGAPKIQGGEDADEIARKRREHVKGVSYISYLDFDWTVYYLSNFIINCFSPKAT